jgi:hypothetical protein
MTTVFTAHSLPKQLFTIEHPAERRSLGFRTPNAERHALVAFIQQVDAELVALGIEMREELPVSDLESRESTAHGIPVPPPTRSALKFLRIRRYNSMEAMYVRCQEQALDLNVCTDLKKRAGHYEFQGTTFDIPDNLDVFRNALSLADIESWD